MAITSVAVLAVLTLTCSVGESATVRFLPASPDKGEAVTKLASTTEVVTQYDFCNTSVTSLVIHKLVIGVEGLVEGKLLINLKAAGMLTKQITGGTVEGIITVGYVLMNLNSELCTVLKSIDYKCPLAAKDYTVSQSFAISEIVELRGMADGSIKIIDQDGDEIACVNVHAQIKAND